MRPAHRLLEQFIVEIIASEGRWNPPPDDERDEAVGRIIDALPPEVQVTEAYAADRCRNPLDVAIDVRIGRAEAQRGWAEEDWRERPGYDALGDLLVKIAENVIEELGLSDSNTTSTRLYAFVSRLDSTQGRDKMHGNAQIYVHVN